MKRIDNIIYLGINKIFIYYDKIIESLEIF